MYNSLASINAVQYSITHCIEQHHRALQFNAPVQCSTIRCIALQYSDSIIQYSKCMIDEKRTLVFSAVLAVGAVGCGAQYTMHSLRV